MSSGKEETPPRSPYNLVNNEGVKRALHAKCGSNVKLRSWEFEDFTSKGDNYACIVSSLVVNYVDNGSKKITTFVVKMNPCREVNFLGNEFYSKEGKFYANVIPELNQRMVDINLPKLKVPICYFAEQTPDCEVVYFEDLRTQGFKMADRKKGLDIPHLNLILEELGRFHGASKMLLKEKSKDDLINQFPCIKEGLFDKDLLNEHAMKTMLESIIKSTTSIIASADSYQNIAKVIEDINYKESILSQLESCSQFDVICHGDCWTNNFLFKYNDCGIPCDVRFLDLQVSRIGSVGLDLNYLLYSSVTGPVRKKHLPVLLSVYYASFCSVMACDGVPPAFSEEEFVEEFKRKNEFGMLMAFMIIPAVVVDAGDVPDLNTISEDEMEAMVEEFGRKMSLNPLIRPRLLDMIDEMIESGVLKVKK